MLVGCAASEWLKFEQDFIYLMEDLWTANGAADRDVAVGLLNCSKHGKI